MKKINQILVRKKYEIEYSNTTTATKRKRNIDWEQAAEMGKYLKLSTPFIMKMFKKFGKNKVLDSKSYLKDFNGDCSLEQALVYKLTKLDI